MNKQDIVMKRGSTLLLRSAIFALGIAVLALCIFAMPLMWREVPNEYPTLTGQLYGLLLTFYAAAIPFFVALFHGLRLLGYIDKNQAFSMLSVRALKAIKYCAIIVSGIFAASLPLFYAWAQSDDAPGLVVIGLILTGAPLVVGVFAAVLQRLLHEAFIMKSEHDLTV